MIDKHKTSASSDVSTHVNDGADDFRDTGVAAIKCGEWQKALENLLEAHRRRPNGPFIRLHLAWVLLEMSRAEEALQHLDALLAENPVYSDLEPLLSELRTRAKKELLVNSTTSTKLQDTSLPKPPDGFISSLKKFFTKH
ncbi:MAG: tetratricopeptide repeat protein [Nitrosomonas sp.]|uniref:tetratricopeptide repeat protein n=1 Tax=Nitrosomonas sp. TaxID=42353 RepID=UPI0025FA42EF|nr:tetratricopeptide repeat protein [Nitrosomonas sp.]MBY0474167.1 tetratricopeptide repeat protein [Nitrosomonas sp.]